ncbi:MAG TPA: TolC family protein, partial [Candidatus Acidoferrum sp.]|nr:TolC family protein [Candidatus Acidoferrum sp.]
RRELVSTGYPQLRFSAGASFAPAAHNFGYDPAITDKGQLSSQLILEQPIYDSGRRRLKIEQADLDIERLSIEQQLAGRDLEFSVKEAFFEILRSQSEVSLRSESARQLSEYLDLVRSLNAGGAVGYTDVLRTQTELQNARLAVDESRQLVAAAKYSLAELLGTPQDTSFVLSGTLDSMTSSAADSAAVPVPYDSSQNLDVITSQLAYERSIADVRDAQKEKLPTLSLVADAGYLTSRDNLQLPASERISGLGYSAGLLFELPIFDWGGRKYRVQQRQLEAESARLQTESLNRSISVEYRKGLVEMQTARARLRVVREGMKTAEDNFLLTKSKYAGGSAPASDVLSAQQLLTESRLSEIETLAELATLQAKLERLTAH